MSWFRRVFPRWFPPEQPKFGGAGASDSWTLYSDALLPFLRAWEGLRLRRYMDAGGLPTIGYGHLLTRYEQMEQITVAQAETMLRADCDRIATAVKSMLYVELAQHQFDALVSFAFNLGPENLRKSTLLRKVNEGRFADAAHEFGRWIHADGKPVHGLERRRKAECAMFERGAYDNLP